MLRSRQVAAVERDMGAWMARFGYAPSAAAPVAYSLSLGKVGLS